MNTTSVKPNLLRAAATYSLYIGLFLIVCDLISSFGMPLIIRLIKLTGSIWLLVYAIKRYRDINNGGYIDYGSAFSFGILTSLFATVLYVAYYFVLISINVTAIQNQLYMAYEDFLQRGLIEDDVYSTFSYVVENVKWFMPLVLFIWSMFLGLIYSLIISAATTRKKSIFEE